MVDIRQLFTELHGFVPTDEYYWILVSFLLFRYALPWCRVHHASPLGLGDLASTQPEPLCDLDGLQGLHRKKTPFFVFFAAHREASGRNPNHSESQLVVVANLAA